jgi:putative redox protein
LSGGVVMTGVGRPGFKFELEHGPSSSRIATEAPKDNGGTGSSFSPTDLVGAALLSCAVTTMALAATRENLSWGEVSGRVEKRMSPPPRRIAELIVELKMSSEIRPEHRARLEEVARGCPVARSLSGDVQVSMTFSYS